MQVYEVYEDLRKHYSESENVAIPVTLEEISNILVCSKRNANFALKRLVEKNWITWKPGRGRGNSSEIVFHLSIEEMYVEVAKAKIEKDDISGSLRIIESHVSDLFLKDKYFKRLHHSFGLSPATIDNEQLDILRVPVIKDIGSLDPILTTCGIEAHIVKHVFDTLVVYNPISNRIETGVAHQWEIRNNHKEWIFYLRKGVLFHDGNELTSTDVENTLKRVNGRDSIYRWIVEDITKIETSSKWKIHIHLKQSNPYFLHYMASHPLSIISEKHGFTLPIGTGSFKVITNDQTALVLEANPYYYAGRPFLDKVELWKTIENSPTTEGIRPDSFQLEKLIIKNDEGEEAWNNAARLENGCKVLTFNLQQEGPHQEKRFRQAMYAALNRTELVKELVGGGYFPAYSLLPIDRDFQVSTRCQQLHQAKKFLEESGYSGEPVHFYCSVYHERDARLLQKVCKQIGIQLELHFLKKSVDNPYPQMEKPHIILYECLFDHDLTFSLLETYMTKDSYILRHLSDEQLTFVKKKINLCFQENHGGLRDVLNEIETFLANELAFICLYRRNKTIQHPQNVNGIQIDPLGWVNFQRIWFA